MTPNLAVLIYEPVHSAAIEQLMHDLFELMPDDQQPTVLYTTDRWSAVDYLRGFKIGLMLYGPSSIAAACSAKLSAFDQKDVGAITLLLLDGYEPGEHGVYTSMQRQAATVLGTDYVADLSNPASHDWLRAQLSLTYDALREQASQRGPSPDLVIIDDPAGA